MTYEEALHYLTTLSKFGINLGLDRIKRLLELMEHPERRYKTVHITGTNGKGSTTAMVASILQASGIRTGMYTSPHLVHYTERMLVDGSPISERDFAQTMHYVAQIVDKMIAEGWEHPTEFEVITAAAFEYFARQGVEYAVIEVGMGGLLDSTNVILPEVAVITNVTLEHTDRCGNTIKEISGHKAGIIKKHKPVITAAKAEALEVIRKQAAEMAAEIFVFEKDFSAKGMGIKNCKQMLEVITPFGPIADIGIHLLGSHQVENAAVAVMTAYVLSGGDSRIQAETVRSGLHAAKWPGRFEVLPGEPPIVIDGAHNPDGAAKLKKTLDEVFADYRRIFVLGILRDKDMSGIVKQLITPDDVVIVVPPSSERAALPEELAGIVAARVVETANTIEQGLKRAMQLAGESDVICAAGSLYLVGDVRNLLKL